jgi:hypothetical protein
MQPTNDNDVDSQSIYSLAEKYLPRHLHKEKGDDRVLYGIGVCIVALVGALVFFMLSRIGNTYYDHSNHVQNITLNSLSLPRELRSWKELSAEEKTAIKLEAKIQFPTIANIGEGVDWKPVAEWLAEKKGVVHSNPRDLFREK